MLGSALLTGVGAALAPASLISVVIFLSNLFLISTYGVLVGALRPIAFPFTGAGVANALVSVGFFNPILVVGLLIPGAAIVGFGVEPFTALLVSLAPPRADFNAPDFGSGILAVLTFGTTEGRLDAMLDAVDEDSGRDDFNGSAVDGLFIPIDEELLGFSMLSTNYCNLEISLFIVSI